eukprot:4254526-Pyramimonas_sp.AAC.1
MSSDGGNWGKFCRNAWHQSSDLRTYRLHAYCSAQLLPTTPLMFVPADDDDYEIPELPKKEEPKGKGLDEEEDSEPELDSKGVPK